MVRPRWLLFSICASAGLSQTSPSTQAKSTRLIHVPPAEFEALSRSNKISLSGGSKARIGSRLPFFSLRDQRKQSWGDAQFLEKATVVVVWATWCLPCRTHLAHIQELHQQLRARPDVQVVGFNIDDDATIALEFLSQKKYTFPNLLEAKPYLASYLGDDRIAIPRQWIVSKRARIVDEQLGATTDPSAWLKTVLGKLTELAALRSP